MEIEGKKQETPGTWMQEMQDEQTKDRKPKLRIGDGEQTTITFQDEGTKITSQYGESILFNILEGTIEKVWFVNTNKYSLLREIKNHKPITGKTCKLTRIGKTKTDTRYSLKFTDTRPIVETQQVGKI